MKTLFAVVMSPTRLIMGPDKSIGPKKHFPGIMVNSNLCTYCSVLGILNQP